MIISYVDRCRRFKAGDETELCEVLHPAREGLDLPCLPYSIAHAVLRPGTRSIPHRLKESSEVYYILEGEGMMQIGGESESVKAGQVVYIPPGAWQMIENIGAGDLKFLAIVCPMWRAEDEELK